MFPPWESCSLQFRAQDPVEFSPPQASMGVVHVSPGQAVDIWDVSSGLDMVRHGKAVTHIMTFTCRDEWLGRKSEKYLCDGVWVQAKDVWDVGRMCRPLGVSQEQVTLVAPQQPIRHLQRETEGPCDGGGMSSHERPLYGESALTTVRHRKKRPTLVIFTGSICRRIWQQGAEGLQRSRGSSGPIWG